MLNTDEKIVAGIIKLERMLEQCHQGMTGYKHFPASPHAVLF